MAGLMQWAYGVTAHRLRVGDLLPRTLASLAAGGFPDPLVSVDGLTPTAGMALAASLGLRVLANEPALGVLGNWLVLVTHLYLRNPRADRYAVFQDDMVCYRNLRGYLERAGYPERGYCNLYTFPCNQEIVERDPTTRQPRVGWFRARDLNPVEGNPRRFQQGKGAVALVFSRDALWTLLSAPSWVRKPAAADPRVATACLDGGIVTAMNEAGWSEVCHHPSLVQHVGTVSTHSRLPHPQATSFHGEGFDALTLLPDRPTAERPP